MNKKAEALTFDERYRLRQEQLERDAALGMEVRKWFVRFGHVLPVIRAFLAQSEQNEPIRRCLGELVERIAASIALEEI